MKFAGFGFTCLAGLAACLLAITMAAIFIEGLNLPAIGTLVLAQSKEVAPTTVKNPRGQQERVIETSLEVIEPKSKLSAHYFYAGPATGKPKCLIVYCNIAGNTVEELKNERANPGKIVDKYGSLLLSRGCDGSDFAILLMEKPTIIYRNRDAIPCLDATPAEYALLFSQACNELAAKHIISNSTVFAAVGSDVRGPTVLEFAKVNSRVAYALLIAAQINDTSRRLRLLAEISGQKLNWTDDERARSDEFIKLIEDAIEPSGKSQQRAEIDFINAATEFLDNSPPVLRTIYHREWLMAYGHNLFIPYFRHDMLKSRSELIFATSARICWLVEGNEACYDMPAEFVLAMATCNIRSEVIILPAIVLNVEPGLSKANVQVDTMTLDISKMVAKEKICSWLKMIADTK